MRAVVGFPMPPTLVRPWVSKPISAAESEVGQPLRDQLHRNAPTSPCVMQLTTSTLTWTISPRTPAHGTPLRWSSTTSSGGSPRRSTRRCSAPAPTRAGGGPRRATPAGRWGGGSAPPS